MLNMLKKNAVMSFLLIALLTTSNALAENKIKAVTSFSILADFVKNVGGDHVDIITLVGPDMDAHIYEPTPLDAKNIKNADVVFINGLNLEGFMIRLIKASGSNAPVIVTTEGITPLKSEEDHADEHVHDHAHEHAHEHEGHHHGSEDPHAWQSIKNAQIYINNIAAGLCKVNANNCVEFEKNANDYNKKLQQLDVAMKAKINVIVPEKRKIITSHDAFGYFAHEYHFTILAPEGVSTESEATAADVAKLITQVKSDKASAIFVENISNPQIINQISRETGLKVGGSLYSDALSKTTGPASTYIDMMNHNVTTIVNAIQ